MTGLHVEREVDALDASRTACGCVDIDDCPGDAQVGGGGLQTVGDLQNHPLQRDARVRADDGVVRASHADVGDVGRAPWEESFIGGEHMRVRPHDGAHATVQVPAQALFFRSRLGVEIHDDYRRLLAHLLHGCEADGERAVDRCHEGASLQAQDADALAFFRLADVDARPRNSLGVIVRAQEARLPRQIGDDRLFVPDVVAGGEDVDAGSQQLVRDLRRDAEACGGVFDVGDAEVDVVVPEDPRQLFLDQPSSRPSKNITDGKNPHN